MTLPIAPSKKQFAIPTTTASANTAISVHVPPVDGERMVNVNYFSYTTGANATTGSHALTFMGAMGVCKVAVAAAAGNATITLDRDPGNYSAAAATGKTPSVANNNISSGDFIAILQPDGLYQKNTCGTNTTLNSNGTLTIEIGTNVPTGGFDAGARVEFYGVPGDTNPLTGRVHPQYLPGVNATLALGNNNAAIATGSIPGTGIIMHSNNTNVAGTLTLANGWFGN